MVLSFVYAFQPDEFHAVRPKLLSKETGAMLWPIEGG